MQIKALGDMKSGEGGLIAQIEGGQGIIGRLAALGIRPGKRITKLSPRFMHGPVTIKLDRTQVAIGFGMSRKIMVEIENTAR